MKALILYVFFVALGTVLAVFVGSFVERHISSAIGSVVFLILFFLQPRNVLDRRNICNGRLTEKRAGDKSNLKPS